MKTEEMVIDCDGHILEPPDLWEKYIDPKYRDRAMRIRVGDDGFEYLEIDRKRAKMTAPGLLGSLGGMGKKVEDARKLREGARRVAVVVRGPPHAHTGSQVDGHREDHPVRERGPVARRNGEAVLGIERMVEGAAERDHC